MGARHVDFGIKNEDYDKVGATLLWTLEQSLGADFTPQSREAWKEVYSTLASVMKTGARVHRPGS